MRNTSSIISQSLGNYFYSYLKKKRLSSLSLCRIYIYTSNYYREEKERILPFFPYNTENTQKERETNINGNLSVIIDATSTDVGFSYSQSIRMHVSSSTQDLRLYNVFQSLVSIWRHDIYVGRVYERTRVRCFAISISLENEFDRSHAKMRKFQ